MENLFEQTIIDQTEIIIVASGTNTKELAMIDEYGKRDNVKIIGTEERETVYQAWNRACRIAQGKYITNANTDDRRRKDSFELMAKALDENEVGVVYADSLITEVENDTFETTETLIRYDWPDYTLGIVLCNFAFGPQPMWRKSVHDEIGYFDESYKIAADYDFLIRVSHKFGALHLRETLGLFHKRADSISGNESQQQTILETQKLLTEHCNNIPLEDIYPGISNYTAGIIESLERDMTETCERGPYKIPYNKRTNGYNIREYEWINSARRANGLKLDENKNWVESPYKETKFWDVYRGQNGIPISENELKDIKACKPRKPKIMFTMYGWNESGGGTMHPKSLALYYASLGYDVSVFYVAGKTEGGDYKVKRSNDQGVELIGVYNRSSIFTEPNIENEIRDDKLIGIFAQALDYYRPDIIHWHNIMGMSFESINESVERFIPNIYTTHNYYLLDPNLYLLKGMSADQRRKQAAKEFHNKIDLTLAVSDRAKTILIGKGMGNNCMSVLHQIPDTTRMLKHKTRKQNNGRMRFGFFGDIIPWKGPQVIVAIAKNVDADFHMHGAIYPGSKDLVASAGDNVYFKGKYHIGDLQAIGDKLDCIIIPSLWEECAGLVIIEALAMGLPVIINNIGGMPEFVQNNVNGMVYNTVPELETILKNLIQNPEQIVRMSKNTGLPYGYEHYANHLLNIYDMVLTDRSDKNYFLQN